MLINRANTSDEYAHRYLAAFYEILPIPDTMGLMGKSFLWIFGKPVRRLVRRLVRLELVVVRIQ